MPQKTNGETGPSPAVGAGPIQNRYMVLAVCGFLLLAVIAVFLQTAWHEFVNYDDAEYVFENQHVKRGLSMEGVSWAITAFHASNWHPLTWLSHMLDCQLYGLHPGGHHLTSVSLHAAAAILLFLALRRMTGALWPCAWVAAVFAIHPLRVESVAWVAERKDVLSALLFMLTLWFYARYVERPASWGRYSLVVAAFALGLTAKPMLVTLPFVLLLLDYWPLRRFSRANSAGSRGDAGAASTYNDGISLRQACTRLVTEKIPLFIVAAVACAVTVAAQDESISSLEQLPLGRRLENATVAYAAYLGKMFWPVDLAVLYPFSKASPPGWEVFGALTVLLAVSTAVFVVRKRLPYLLVGWLWYLGMMVPVIGLMQVGTQKMADRYTYLTQVGLYMALAWSGVQVAGIWPVHRRKIGIIAVVVVAALMACAWQQTRHWRNSETLWTHTLECTSQNPFAHYNLGVALAHSGRIDEAIVHYRKALKIRPKYAEAYYNLGMALKQRGQVEEAFTHYRKAVEINPNFAEAYMNLGNVLADRKQIDAAIAHYQKALELKPDSPEAENNLGTALGGRGRQDEAIAHYRKALKLKPDYIDAYNNLGAALAGRGQFGEAIDCFREALQIRPDYAITHLNLGIALARSGKPNEAIGHYQKALELATANNDRGLAGAIRARMNMLQR